MKKRGFVLLAIVLLAAAGAGTWFATTPPSGGPADGETVEIVVPAGAGALAIGRQLRAEGLVRVPRLFALAARARGVEGSLKAGRYRVTGGMGWGEILDVIAAGEVVTFPLTVPEGFTVRELAPRVAEATGVDADSVARLATDSAFVVALGVPGPTLEGYLFPETYRFSEGVERRLEIVRDHGGCATRSFWGTRGETGLARQHCRLDEREVVTLASIVEEEARVPKRSVPSSRVRLPEPAPARGGCSRRIPTVQYALGEPKERLLYSDIDAGSGQPLQHVHGTPGLPPGPIASPGESLAATLCPASRRTIPYLFFVARADGSHEFTRTNREHINARNRIRRENAESDLQRQRLRLIVLTHPRTCSWQPGGCRGRVPRGRLSRRFSCGTSRRPPRTCTGRPWTCCRWFSAHDALL